MIVVSSLTKPRRITIEKSVRVKRSAARNRSVVTRLERIAWFTEADAWEERDLHSTRDQVLRPQPDNQQGRNEMRRPFLPIQHSAGVRILRQLNDDRLVAKIVLTVAAIFIVTATAYASSIGSPSQIGTISASVLPEVSGIADGRATPNTFWVHNDKGDTARFFAINHQGTLLGAFPLAGAPSGDWEDIAIGPKSGGGNYLYLGDIGDNDANRTSISVYRTTEPASTTSATIAAGNFSTAILHYPSGSRNAESLIVDPLTSDIFIITKASVSEIYSAPASAFSNGTTSLTSRVTLGSPLSTATAADISPDGRHILVRSKTVGYLFERGMDQSVADALHGPGVPFVLGAESQGEAIGWASDGTGFYTTSESNGLPSAPIYHYSFTEPSLSGDYNQNHAIDAADYVIWRKNVGAPAGTLPNDTAGGMIGQPQYDAWRTDFGAAATGSGTSTDSLTVHSVPEPPGALLLIVSAFLYLSIRPGSVR